MMKAFNGLGWLLFVLWCADINASNLSSQLKVPLGFTIEEFASVPNARQMALTSSGHIVVGTRRQSIVYGLKKQSNQASHADHYELIKLVTGLNMPAGVAIDSSGDLYIAATHQILSIKNIDDGFTKNQFQTSVVTDTLPNYDHHGWKHIGFSPKGNLVIPFGVPCNICLSTNPIIGSLQSFDLKSKTMKPLAVGVRNSVGFDWHPATQQLWFSDNGRDWMGDDQPADEINRVNHLGDHFGFPYLHGRSTYEPDSSIQAAKPKNLKMIPPSVEIQAHSAPLGIHFYTGKQFPSHYRNALFVALHGSWNRSTPVGYKIMVYWFDQQHQLVKEETIVEGFLVSKGPDKGKKLGRPVDFLQLPDGSLLISDDMGGVLWRLSYSADSSPPHSLHH